MRILMIIGVFPRTTETFLVRQAIGLNSLNNQVAILCRRFDREALEAMFPHFPRDIEIIEQPSRPGAQAVLHFLKQVTNLYFTGRGARNLKAQKCLLQRFGVFRGLAYVYLSSPLLAFKADVAHFQFPSSALGHIAYYREAGVPCVVSFRGSDAYTRGRDRADYYDEIWANAAAVHCVSNSLKAVVLDRGMPKYLLATVVETALDSSWFNYVRYNKIEDHTRTEDLNTPALRILMVGRLSNEKRHQLAILALSQLRLRGLSACLTIVGEGRLKSDLSAVARKYDVESYVTLLGSISPESVKIEMRRHDLLLHTSLYEGFGNVLAEAQSVGLPVVATNSPGVRDALLDGEMGTLVDGSSPAEIADCLMHAHERIDELRELSGPIARAAARRYSLERQARELTELYAHAIQ